MSQGAAELGTNVLASDYQARPSEVKTRELCRWKSLMRNEIVVGLDESPSRHSARCGFGTADRRHRGRLAHWRRVSHWHVGSRGGPS